LATETAVSGEYV